MSTRIEPLIIVRKHVKTSEKKWHKLYLRPLIGPKIFPNVTFYIVINIKFKNTISLALVRVFVVWLTMH